MVNNNNINIILNTQKIPTNVSYICFKNIAKLHIHANNLPQIRLNV